MIKMSQKAAVQFKADLRIKSLPESTMLRIIARGEREEEMRLALVLDTDEPNEDDEAQITEGVRLAVDKDLARTLGNAQLDYREEAGGFVLKRVELIQ